MDAYFGRVVKIVMDTVCCVNKPYIDMHMNYLVDKFRQIKKLTIYVTIGCA
jgi:hypothetical protein